MQTHTFVTDNDTDNDTDTDNDSDNDSDYDSGFDSGYDSGYDSGFGSEFVTKKEKEKYVKAILEKPNIFSFEIVERQIKIVYEKINERTFTLEEVIYIFKY